MGFPLCLSCHGLLSSACKRICRPTISQNLEQSDNEEQRTERHQGKFHAGMQSFPTKTRRGSHMWLLIRIQHYHPSDIFVHFNAHSGSKQRDEAAEKTLDLPVAEITLRAKTCHEYSASTGDTFRRHLLKPLPVP